MIGEKGGDGVRVNRRRVCQGIGDVGCHGGDRVR